MMWGDVRSQVLQRDKHKCVVCGEAADEVDHIIEKVRGGPMFDPKNLQTLCKTHHREKTARFLRFWLAKNKEKVKPEMFNEQLEKWVAFE